jgi:hypothetical protein
MSVMRASTRRAAYGAIAVCVGAVALVAWAVTRGPARSGPDLGWRVTAFGKPQEPVRALVPMSDHDFRPTFRLAAGGPGAFVDPGTPAAKAAERLRSTAIVWLREVVRPEWLPANLDEYLTARRKWPQDVYVVHYAVEVAEGSRGSRTVECQFVDGVLNLTLCFRGLGELAAGPGDPRTALDRQAEWVLTKGDLVGWEERDWSDDEEPVWFVGWLPPNDYPWWLAVSGWTNGTDTVFVVDKRAVYVMAQYPSPDSRFELDFRFHSFLLDPGSFAARHQFAKGRRKEPVSDDRARELASVVEARTLPEGMAAVWLTGDQLSGMPVSESREAARRFEAILQPEALPEDVAAWCRRATAPDDWAGAVVAQYLLGSSPPRGPSSLGWYIQIALWPECARVTAVRYYAGTRGDDRDIRWDLRRARADARRMMAALFQEGEKLAVLPYRVVEIEGPSALGVPDVGTLRVGVGKDAPPVSAFWWGNIRFWTDMTVYHYEVAFADEDGH